MKPIAIYGAGGFGREALSLIRNINADQPAWDIIGFFDDSINKGSRINRLEVVGTMDDLNNHDTPLNIVLAIGDPSVRKFVHGKIDNKNIEFPSLIHPSAILQDRERIKTGPGSLITAGVIITTNVSIGEHVIINLNTTIGHDCHLDRFASVMPGCNLAGNVTLEEGAFLGSGTNVINGLTIGKNAFIGAGSVVTKDIPANTKAVGVPARAI